MVSNVCKVASQKKNIVRETCAIHRTKLDIFRAFIANV